MGGELTVLAARQAASAVLGRDLGTQRAGGAEPAEHLHRDGTRQIPFGGPVAYLRTD